MSRERSRRNPWYVSSPFSNSTTRYKIQTLISSTRNLPAASYIATALKENEKLSAKLLKLIASWLKCITIIL